MKNERFYFIVNGKNTLSYSLIGEVFDRKNVFSLRRNGFKETGNLLKPFIYCIKLFNKLFLSEIKKFPLKNCRDKIVVLTNESLSFIDEKLLLSIKKEAKAVVLFLIDEMFNEYKSMENAKKYLEDKDRYFDLVYTFSPKDAKEYGFLLNFSYYPKFFVKSKKSKSDLFYIGNVKNRKEMLLRALEILKEKEISPKFFVVGIDYGEKKVLLDKKMSYKESLKHLLSSNCILDIADERQTGMTLRYYEAITFNKKLLTNNGAIVNMPYYNSENMRVYNTVEDIALIDEEWFKSCDNVDYGYEGEFAPLGFLSTIEKDLADKL